MYDRINVNRLLQPNLAVRFQKTDPNQFIISKYDQLRIFQLVKYGIQLDSASKRQDLDSFE